VARPGANYDYTYPSSSVLFYQSPKVKRLIIDLLRKLASTTDNTVDDKAVDFIERGLFSAE